jgi:hypothetical protein
LLPSKKPPRLTSPIAEDGDTLAPIAQKTLEIFARLSSRTQRLDHSVSVCGSSQRSSQRRLALRRANKLARRAQPADADAHDRAFLFS